MAGHNIPITAAIRAYPRVAHLAPASYRRDWLGANIPYAAFGARLYPGARLPGDGASYLAVRSTAR